MLIRKSGDLLRRRQNCRIEPPGTLAGERVAFGGQAGNFVPRALQIVLERVPGTGEIPCGGIDLLDHDLDLIASSRMNFWSNFISILLIVIAQMSDAVSIRPQRIFKFV